jgi:hypothetical protein
MMMNEKKETPTLLGVMPTLAAGFDLVSKHLWLLVVPVALDLFLWLGTRLGAQVFMDEMVSFWQQENALLALDPAIIEQFMSLTTRTNLFATLSVPMIGVPTFMSGITPELTPIKTAVFEVNSIIVVVLSIILLSVIGLFITAVYYNLIAYVLRRNMGDDMPLPTLIARIGQSWLLLLLLGVLLAIALFILYIPMILLATGLAAINPVLGGAAAVFAPILLFSIVLQFIFVPHGLILHDRPLGNAMVESSLILRKHWIEAITLFFTIVLINYLMNSIMLLADSGSWLTGASIIGHAFVATAMVTAVFIFYHDRFTLLNVPQKM